MSPGDSINQRKNGANDGIYESSEGPNFLSHVKSSGGMTISPELFEKVCLRKERTFILQLSLPLLSNMRSYTLRPKLLQLAISESALQILHLWD
jgi:hypothetical protein